MENQLDKLPHLLVFLGETAPQMSAFQELKVTSGNCINIHTYGFNIRNLSDILSVDKFSKNLG